MRKQKEYIDSVEGNAHQSAVRIIGELEAENAKLREGRLSESEMRITRQALKIWRGDYPESGCKPTLVWQKEVGQIIDKLTLSLKGDSDG